MGLNEAIDGTTDVASIALSSITLLHF